MRLHIAWPRLAGPWDNGQDRGLGAVHFGLWTSSWIVILGVGIGRDDDHPVRPWPWFTFRRRLSRGLRIPVSTWCMSLLGIFVRADVKS